MRVSVYSITLFIVLMALSAACESDSKTQTNNNTNSIPKNTIDKTKGSLSSIQPAFSKVNVPYEPGKKLTSTDLEPLTEMELSLMRVKLYDQNGYDFEKLWRREYNKGKYGYVIKPDYRVMELKPLDQANDILIVTELERKKKENKAYRYLAFNASHVTKEISYSFHSQKYFSSVKDQNPLPFSDDNIPSGVVKPETLGEISKDNWTKLLTGDITLLDIGLQKSHRIVYLVQYWPNKKIKYVISHETFGARLSEQDARNFSLYDYNGILRRSIYLVGNQDVYERDYFYDKEGNIICVVQKVIQNNRLARMAVFRLNKLAVKSSLK